MNTLTNMKDTENMNATRQCPRCSFPNAVTNQFCAQCGNSLSSSMLTPSIKLLLGLVGLLAAGVIVLAIFISRSDRDYQRSSTRTQLGTTTTVQTQPTQSAFIEDPAGDVRDGNHQKPSQKLPGTDLSKTTIETAGPNLTITFTVHGNFQEAIQPGQSAVWTVTACNQDGHGCCIVGAKQIGGEWLTYVFDMSTSRNTYLSKPTVSGSQLTVTAKLEELPTTMRSSFRWFAESEWDGKWRDRIPDEGNDFLNSPTVPFP